MNPCRIVLAACVAAIAACADSTTSGGDHAGTALISLASPHTTDGAIALIIRGPGLFSATALDSTYTVYSRLVGPSELKVMVLGESLTPGALVRVGVGAINRLSDYSVQVDAVAAPSDSLRADVSSYQASLTVYQGSLAAAPN